MRGALLAVALAGCSALNPPTDHLPEPIPADDFCGVYAEVMCDGVVGCCPEAAMASREECVSVVGLYCANGLSPILTDARTGYDAEEAGYQLNVARDYVESCDPRIAAWQNRFDGLVASLLGTVPEGGACDPIFVESFEEGRYDAARFYSCSGGSGCRPTALSEWRCLERGGIGAGCVGIVDCADGLTCAPVSDVRGECGPRLPDGAACAADAQCDSYDCSACAGDACTCQPDDDPGRVYCGLLR